MFIPIHSIVTVMLQILKYILVHVESKYQNSLSGLSWAMCLTQCFSGLHCWFIFVFSILFLLLFKHTVLFTRKESNPHGWTVSLGSVLRSGLGALVIPVQRIIQHPAFNSSNMDFDVALVQLSIPAPSSYTIQTLCLPSPTHSFFKGTECYITGWGSMREDGEKVFSAVLLNMTGL